MGENKTFPIISFNNNLFLSEIVMYYLTQFDTEAEYTAYKNSANFKLPNVTYVKETKNTYFTPRESDGSSYSIVPFKLSDYPTTSFGMKDSVKMVTVPENTTSFVSRFANGGYFAGMVNLKEIVLPPTVVSLGDQFCDGCTSLTKINLEDTQVSVIPSAAFNNCKNLAEITLPSTVTRIKNMAFRNCKYGMKVYIKTSTPPTLEYSQIGTTISRYVFNDSGCLLYVPVGAKEAYLADEGWSHYFTESRVFEYNFD